MYPIHYSLIDIELLELIVIIINSVQDTELV